MSLKQVLMFLGTCVLVYVAVDVITTIVGRLISRRSARNKYGRNYISPDFSLDDDDVVKPIKPDNKTKTMVKK